jgi:hypothetical protein
MKISHEDFGDCLEKGWLNRCFPVEKEIFRRVSFLPQCCEDSPEEKLGSLARILMPPSTGRDRKNISNLYQSFARIH